MWTRKSGLERKCFEGRARTGRARRRGAGVGSVRGRGRGKRERKEGGTAQKVGGTKGMRERGGGGKSQCQATGLQRGKGSRGGKLSPKESLSTAARNERMWPVGPRREERTAGGTGGRREAVRGSCGIVEGRRAEDMQARRTRGHRGCAREARQEVARNQLCRKRKDGFMLPTPSRVGPTARNMTVRLRFFSFRGY